MHGDAWMQPQNFVSNGPFILKELKRNKYIFVEKNPYYFNSNNKQIQGIRFLINNDFNKQIKSYEENNIHVTCNTLFPYNLIENYKNCLDFNIEPFLLLSYININFAKGDFINKKVRQMLYYAIDKEYIADKLSNGINSNYDFVPLGIKNYKPINPISYNPEKARKILSEFPNIKRTYELIYADFYPNKEILSYVSKFWEEVLNIKVNLLPVSFDCLIDKLCNNNFDLCLSLIAARYNEPSAYLEDFAKPSLLMNKYDEYNKLLVKAVETHNATIKKDIYKDINNILIDILPIFPLFSFNSIYLKKPYIKNFKIFPCGHFSFRDLDIEKI